MKPYHCFKCALEKHSCLCSACSKALITELARACRYRLRELTAQCLPYAVEDILLNKCDKVLEVPCDCIVMKALLSGISQSVNDHDARSDLH